jgi:protein-S-isoprenylcysteine O-methyltransferase Ste14
VREEAERRARERAEAILGFVSLVLWFVVAFGLSIALWVDEDHPRPILMAGGIALLVAALPWLGYRWLVRRSLRPRR